MNNITNGKMIHELRKMQAQIIHGTEFFGEVTDRIEALQNSLEAAKRAVEETKPILKYLMDECDESVHVIAARKAFYILDHAINAERKEKV